MKLSVVIVTYNSKSDILDCLDALYSHNDLGQDLEVIVVDNNSEDQREVFSSISHRYPSVHCISNPKNGGYGQGNNLGIAAASSDIVMIMNPDVRWLDENLQQIIDTFTDEHVVQVGFTMKESRSKEGSSYSYLNSSSGFKKCIGNILAHRLHYFNARKMYFSGACFAMRKSAFETIGGFDENIFMYGEENDIHFRLLQQFPKGKIMYLRDISYLHPMHQRSFREDTEKKRIASNVYVMRKQGISAASYLKSEISRIRWMRLISVIIGTHQDKVNCAQKIKLYQTLMLSLL